MCMYTVCVPVSHSFLLKHHSTTNYRVLGKLLAAQTYRTFLLLLSTHFTFPYFEYRHSNASQPYLTRLTGIENHLPQGLPC